MISETVYLNGKFLPLTEAKISPLDRGFLFADGVYELIPVYSRHAFRLAGHLARLHQSLNGLQLDNPHSLAEWQTIIEALIAAAPWEDQGLYLQVTRGADLKRDLPFPQTVTPTVFAMSMPLVTPSATIRASGVAAITAPDPRWLHCDWKTLALLPNVLLRQQAAAADCAETILLRDGLLSEGASSSVFVVSKGTLLAPPPSNYILPGVTADVVQELAQSHGLPLTIRPISETELRAADEVWITASTKEVLAVTTLDGRPVGNGQPGPISQQMWHWYQQFKETEMRHG